MSLIEPSIGLFDTTVELDTVERGLRRGLGTTKRCGGEKTVTRIGENQGFFSRVGLLKCNWPSDDGNLPSEVVVKITTLLNTVAMHSRGRQKEARRDRNMWTTKANKLRKWHNNEILFYESIRPNSPPSVVPTMYCGRRFDADNEDVGFLCLEFAGGCSVRHIYQNLTVEQVNQTLRSLALIQHSMDSVPEEIKEKFTVEPYEELYADILAPEVLSFRLDELRAIDSSLALLIQQVEDSAAVSTKMPRRQHIDMGMGAVFVHGDLYSPNLLWKTEENTSTLHKIIDWQLCHFGSAAEDLCRLLISGLSTEDRRNQWEQIIKDYYTVLSRQMEHVPFSLEQLISSCRHMFCLVALAFIATVPEVYRAASQTFTDEERTVCRSVMAEKVRGILEDVLIFSQRKHG